MRVEHTERADGTIAGALVVLGGVGVKEDLYIGAIDDAIGTVGTYTGAAIFAGGVCITKNLIIGSSTKASDVTSGALVIGGGLGIGDNVIIGNNSDSSNVNSGALVISGGIGAGGRNYFSGVTNITNNTIAASTDNTSGALVVMGGVNIGNNLAIGSLTNSSGTNTGAIVIGGGIGSNGVNYFGGVTNIVNTTTASSINTTIGALVISGGANIRENLVVGSGITVPNTSVPIAPSPYTSTTLNYYESGAVDCVWEFFPDATITVNSMYRYNKVGCGGNALVTIDFVLGFTIAITTGITGQKITLTAALPSNLRPLDVRTDLPDTDERTRRVFQMVRNMETIGVPNYQTNNVIAVIRGVTDSITGTPPWVISIEPANTGTIAYTGVVDTDTFKIPQFSITYMTA